MDQQTQSAVTRWIDRAIIACLFLFAAFAPHSIAVTQTAWLLGMLMWVIRFAFYPPPRTDRTPLDYALLGFFILTGLAAFLSYEPLVSIGKLRAASLFTIVYLIAENVRSLRLVRLLAMMLVASTMVNVLVTVERQIVGSGVKLEGVREDSPLREAMTLPHTTARPVPIMSGDTIFEVDGQEVSTPDDVARALAAPPNGTPTASERGTGQRGSSPPVTGGPAAVIESYARVRIYHVEWRPLLEVPRGRLLPGTTALEQLGVSSWSRGRDWRATGFFGHWITYAESLQLIGSLALGLFLVCPQKRQWPGVLLLLAVIGLVLALGLTVTRASWLAFVISAGVMLVLVSSRRVVLLVGVCALPLLLGALFVLQQKRQVGFFDQRDQSTTWRETVWREGSRLLLSKPRHLLVGVGMDSIKAHRREWGLFDQGRLPLGHMHSNLLQIALERGVPALIVWLLLLGAYARLLFGLLKKTHHGTTESTEHNSKFSILNSKFLERGIVLGALGGLVGFFVSGLVHYNWGDSEVVMIVYFLMGLTLVIYREHQGNIHKLR